MKKIFEPARLGNLAIKNRLVRSATVEAGAFLDGAPTPLLKEIYDALALGGAGLIITGMVGVCPGSRALTGMGKAYGQAFVPAFSEITQSVHEKGGKIVVQLCHCGAKAMAAKDGALPPGPTGTEGLVREIPLEELNEMVFAFGQAALQCKRAGADGVQIHAAHGYLISEFLSPYYNKRQDRYGGSLENRARLLFLIYDEIRKQTGPQYPVLIKINSSDLAEPGFTEEECALVCRELSRRGLDAAEISGGISIDKRSQAAQPVKGEQGEGYFGQAALRIAEKAGLPVISVGGYRTPGVIDRYLNAGGIEAASLCRPLIREPNLPRRWESGELSRAGCISCGRCSGGAILGCPVKK